MIKWLLNSLLLGFQKLAHYGGPRIFRFVLLLTALVLPNTAENNLMVWSRYDWSSKGEEWSNSRDWKESFLKWVLFPHIPEESRVLEIGPGAGRWTEFLIKRSRHLVVVDLVPECIELCRKRFGLRDGIEYHVNDGRDLSFIPSHSVDRIWSWDVFVHLSPEAAEAYISRFSRILACAGEGIIHHARAGVSMGWRSHMTSQKMQHICWKHGLHMTTQFNSWNDGQYHIWPELPLEEDPDTITVFVKV